MTLCNKVTVIHPCVLCAPPISRSVVWSPGSRRWWNVISADFLLLVLLVRVQVDGCVVLVTKALNRFQASPRLTCGGPSGHRTGCSPSTSVLRRHCPKSVPYSFICRGNYELT